MGRHLVLLPAASLLVAGVVLCAYVRDTGAGLKQDDFRWIATSRVRTAGDAAALLARNTGFYRPAVAATFAMDELAFGMRPLGYGLTNLALLIGCLFAIAALARALGLEAGAALVAGAVWALNFQGINMAVVWTSGRTALLLVLFAVLAARAFARGSTVVAAIFTLLALLSKEEAVMLPALFFVWCTVEASGTGRAGAARRAARATWPFAVPLVAYALLRNASGAFGPLSAPSYYRFTFAPATVANNALRYLDFAGTWPAIVVVLASALARARPRPSPRERRVILLGAIWVAAGYAITVFLPIRSPLYACFPAVGAALACAALVEAVWSSSVARTRTQLVAAGLLVPFLLLPVHWARNVRHAKGARLSAQLLHDLDAARSTIPPDAIVVFIDDVRAKPTERLEAAFGGMCDLAVRDTLGRPVQVWVEPPQKGWESGGLQRPGPAARTAVFALKRGRLVRQPS